MEWGDVLAFMRSSTSHAEGMGGERIEERGPPQAAQGAYSQVCFVQTGSEGGKYITPT